MKPVFQLVLGAFFTALVSAAFAISFATILYRGALAPFLDQGIALTLVGATVVAVTGALSLSFKGSILGPQDVPAILIASGAAALVAQNNVPPEALFATVACLVGVTSITTGILGVTLGRLRLAHVTRFFPYPVLAGFLATTGLLLFRSGLELSLGEAFTGQISAFLAQDNLIRWVPTFAVALLMCICTRRFTDSFVMPLALIAALLGLYGIYRALGLGAADLRSAGLLLGPFPSGGFAAAVTPMAVLDADWWLILSSAPLIVTGAVSALVGMTLNASGIELELKRDLDPDKEARGTGLANIFAGFLGGIPAYHVVGETLLANRLGLRGALAGISAACGCGFLFFFGAGLLNLLPVAFFGAVIAYLGIDLLYGWLWAERKRFRRVDYAIVLAIPLAAVTLGFLPAIAVGLLLCAAIFVLEYSRLDVVRRETNLTGASSRVERPASDLVILDAAKDSAKVLELATFLFFGSSQALRSKVQSLLRETPQLRWLVLDFKAVQGLDVSAAHILERIRGDCEGAGVELLMTGLDGTDLPQMQASDDRALHASIARIEDIILDAAKDRTASVDSDLATFLQSPAMRDRCETRHIPHGDTVIAEGSTTRDVYVLLQGRLQVIFAQGTPDEKRLATILAGAVVGEMAYYTANKRSAAIVAEGAVELLCITSARIDALEQEAPQLAATFHRLIAGHLAARLGRANGQLMVTDG